MDDTVARGIWRGKTGVASFGECLDEAILFLDVCNVGDGDKQKPGGLLSAKHRCNADGQYKSETRWFHDFS
jgi:hypothetical protein